MPAIHIDARVLAFLRKYDAAPDQLDTQELTDALLAAMQRGLRGEAGGLPMAQRLELDYLIYNDPLGYADLILNGNLEEYLKNVTGSHGLED